MLFTKQANRNAGALIFQLPSANGADRLCVRNDHLGAYLARRRTADAYDAHEDRGLSGGTKIA